MSNKYFTCVGSRSTPKDILYILTQVSKYFCQRDYILRSGGADGADLAGESGCDLSKGRKEIYLPWRGFNGDYTSPYNSVGLDALKLASTIHPAWNNLSEGAKKLHGRNCYQVLGYDLKTPSQFLICWTKNGEKIGGTRTAIVLAENYNIPVINIGMYTNPTCGEILKIIYQKLNNVIDHNAICCQCGLSYCYCDLLTDGSDDERSY